MKQFFLFLCFFSAFGSFNTLAGQSASEALRFAYVPQYGGTARTFGLGGSLSSIGGDFSTLSTNPAGLATYRRGEFMITPGFKSAVVASELLKSGSVAASPERSNNFTLSNFGFVISITPRESRWKTLNFAIGYNHLIDFSNDLYFEGTSIGSIMQRWQDKATQQAGNLDVYETSLAEETGAIIRRRTGNAYTSDWNRNPNAGIFKNQLIETVGGMGEYVFSAGANYNEALQLGATVGVVRGSIRETKFYKEEDILSEVDSFEALSFDEHLKTNISGVNFKFGAIIKPTKFLRVGLAIHSPTIQNLSDTFFTISSYSYTDGRGARQSYEAGSPSGVQEYNLTTPWRWVGALGAVFGKSGLFNAEVEYANYATTNYKLASNERDYENELNKEIIGRYKSALNVRFGGEYVYDIFRFRGGAGFAQSPRQDKDFWNPTYSAGFGIRGNSYFLDFAWQGQTFKENYTPYKLGETVNVLEPSVTSKYKLNNYLVTVGFKF
jgi:hypothetical protein